MNPTYIILLLLLTNNLFSQIERRNPIQDNFNKIIQTNQKINVTLNQYLVYWNDIPFKIKNAKRVKETLYFTRYDTTSSIDTIIYCDNSENILYKFSKKYYDYKTLENDTLIISVIDTMMMNTDSLEIIVEGPSQMIYLGNQLISESNRSEKLTYTYQTSGHLKDLTINNLELNIHNFMTLSSEQSKDSTIYSIDYNQGDYKLFDPEKLTIFKIKMYKLERKGCFQYYNSVFVKRYMDSPIINKILSICEDGTILEEIERELHVTKPNIYYKYNIKGGNIEEKMEKIGADGKYFNHKSYEYDNKDRLVKIVGRYFYSLFEYDDRNNIIKRIDYSDPAQGPDKIIKYWTREIEYIE